MNSFPLCLFRRQIAQGLAAFKGGEERVIVAENDVLHRGHQHYYVAHDNTINAKAFPLPRRTIQVGVDFLFGTMNCTQKPVDLAWNIVEASSNMHQIITVPKSLKSN